MNDLSRVMDNRCRSSRGGRPRRGCAGFSLIELLIMLAVAIVLASMGITQVSEGIRQFRLQQAASTVAGKLMDARLSALKRNRPTWLAIDVEASTVRVQMTGGGGAAVDVGPVVTLPQGITFTVAPAQVDYDALGRLGAVQAITVSNGAGGSRLVTVSVTGTTSVTTVD